MRSDIELLKSRVLKQTTKIRDRQKAMYQLARELGFSASEAVVLQNWSETRIRALVESKEFK